MTTDDSKKSPSAIVLPFGKHKGATVAELLVKDPAYAEWIANQGWVAERFAELHAAILSRGTATDDSPEHNAIQVRFLDREFCLAFLFAGVPGELSEQTAYVAAQIPSWIASIEREISSPRFEYFDTPDDRAKKVARSQVELDLYKTGRISTWSSVKFEQRGVDVVLYWGIRVGKTPVGTHRELSVEIKPTMGDDFPSVMRQMARLRSQILVVGEYTGRAVSEPQLRQMFAANNQTLLFVRDIEAEIANARAELA